MATNLQQQAARSTDAAFVDRVRAAIMREIPGVFAEAASVAGHSKRILLARQLMTQHGWSAFVPLLAAATAGDVSVRNVDDTAAVTDGQIQSALMAQWSTVAGHATNEPVP